MWIKSKWTKLYFPRNKKSFSFSVRTIQNVGKSFEGKQPQKSLRFERVTIFPARARIASIEWVQLEVAMTTVGVIYQKNDRRRHRNDCETLTSCVRKQEKRTTSPADAFSWHTTNWMDSKEEEEEGAACFGFSAFTEQTPSDAKLCYGPNRRLSTRRRKKARSDTH